METNEFTLNILKALRESAGTRWEKRREYEWKLSFALWTAIAAFIAIAIGKDVAIRTTTRVAIVVGIGGVTITFLHCLYLLGIISNTLKDLDKMEYVEDAMRATLPASLLEKWPPRNQGIFAQYHGLLQFAITAVLCAGAFFSVMAPRADRQATATTSPPTSGIVEVNPRK